MKLSFRQISKLLPGFTLIEILVVLAIVGILMSLMFPAVNGALNSARKAMAQNDVVQIANAVKMYETEYGKLPPNNTTVSDDLLDALTATTTNNNRRRIVFIETREAKKNRSGTNSTGFVDPWEGLYQIALNTNYTGTIEVGWAKSPGGKGRVHTVGVWNENETSRLNVVSW
jgi:type II secretion system protein G